VDADQLDDIVRIISTSFMIRFVDFGAAPFEAYRRRKIGGFVRFDERTVFFDVCLPSWEEDVTWAHEVLSIYYYDMCEIIRHDDEIEREARKLCEDECCRAVLERYRNGAKELSLSSLGGEVKRKRIGCRTQGSISLMPKGKCQLW